MATLHKLSDQALRKAKAASTPRKLADGGGLYVILRPNGSRWWRLTTRAPAPANATRCRSARILKYRSRSRARRDDYRRQLAAGIDPGEKREAEKSADANTFEAIAREWFAKFSPGWVASHGDKILRRLERDIFPWIGTKPIAAVTAPQLLAALRRVEERGALETAHRAHQNCGQIFRYAVATGRAERDPSADLRGALPPVKETHHASITDPTRIGQLLRAMDGYEGTFIARAALRLAPLVFVRPGELRRAEWSEIDLDAAEWHIPAARMKMRAPHVVPLSKQAVAILRELHPLTGVGTLVFPGVRDIKRPMSENTILAALRRMGYSGDEMTGHGFRSMASTLLNEQGWNRDAIERQLAHAERDSVRAAYNYAEFLPERRKMMQAWADYLDTLRAAAASPRPASTGVTQASVTQLAPGAGNRKQRPASFPRRAEQGLSQPVTRNA